MSPSSELVPSAKRQRPVDAVQDLSRVDADNRSKRLKTRQDGQPKKGKKIGNSSTGQIAVQKTPKWSLDVVSRGQVYNTEPVFSVDEKYIFLSLGNAVQVFSIQARRPIRILQIEKGGHVTGIKTSPLDPQHIYVSTSSGNLVRVNWESNNEAGKWTRLGEAICCEIIHVNVQDKEHIAYFSVTKKGPEQWVIKVNTFLPSQPGNSTETVVLESSKLLDRLQVLQDGHAIVACAGQHAVIGTLTQKQNKKSPFSGYVWREVRLPVSKITSFDAREARAQPSDKATSIDLAIGEASGAILLYQDILGGGSSGDIAKNGLPLLQRLHWHREAVSSVRWSRDGNYVISGGKESSLVFWQLDSGRKNFLPHFPSSIHAITVSPGGALYAIQLTEKSIIVLSATELEPVASINGLRLPAIANPADFKKQYSSQYPVTLHPNRPERLSVAVPSDGSKDLSFLHTLNVQTGSYISRQALTRTNVTTMNKGPEGNPIGTPSVKFMEMGDDGKWFVTVDSWSPPQPDLKAFGPSLSLNHRSEIYLKFWSWNETQELWELVTRVESPHFSADNPAEVFCLAARPGRHEFVTFGADKLLKVWQPTARRQKSSKNQSSSPLDYTWKCGKTVDLTGHFKAGQNYGKPVLDFSADGSVLVLSTNNVIQLVDTHQWTICSSRSVSSEVALAVKFLNQSLIVLFKQSLVMWNMVDNCLKTVTDPTAKTFISLAVDLSANTIAVTYLKGTSRPAYGISVYDASRLIPLFQADMEEIPLNLVSDPSTGDYIVVDTSANLKRASCYGSRKSQALQISTIGYDDSVANLGGIFGNGSQIAPKTQQISGVADVQIKGLDRIFDRAPSFALPPASALFKDVINSLVTSS